MADRLVRATAAEGGIPHPLFVEYLGLLRAYFGENFDHPKYDLPLFPDKKGRPLKRE